jgi:putative oxidoreductase
MDIGLLFLRLTVGITLAAHGTQKLFGWFGGPGLNATGQFFAMIGFPPGRRHALMAGIAETAGGLLLAVGFLTPLGSAAVIAVMIVAVFSVHIEKGFFAQNGGYEYNLMLAVAALMLAFTGPGLFSLDALLGIGHSGLPLGLGALVFGIIGGVVALLERKAAPSIQTTIGKQIFSRLRRVLRE